MAFPTLETVAGPLVRLNPDYWAAVDKYAGGDEDVYYRNRSAYVRSCVAQAEGAGS